MIIPCQKLNSSIWPIDERTLTDTTTLGQSEGTSGGVMVSKVD